MSTLPSYYSKATDLIADDEQDLFTLLVIGRYPYVRSQVFFAKVLSEKFSWCGASEAQIRSKF